jgi:hypothetical protein
MQRRSGRFVQRGEPHPAPHASCSRAIPSTIAADSWRLDECNSHTSGEELCRLAESLPRCRLVLRQPADGVRLVTHAHDIFKNDGITFPNIFSIQNASALAFVLLALSVLIGVWSVIPRLPTKQLSGLVFWESILVHATGDLYARTLVQQDESALTEHLCVQVHTVAGVAQTKYKYVSISMWLGLVGSICAGFVLLLK